MHKYLIALSFFLLTACGFHPVHGVNKYTPTGVETRMQQVAIGNIPDYEGQFLRNDLIDRFYRDGRPANPAYTLKVENLQESLADLDITKTADATRGQLRLDATLILTDNISGKPVLERKIRSITSYNILAGEFATRVTEKNARENALRDLARQIELQVKLYLKRNQ